MHSFESTIDNAKRRLEIGIKEVKFITFSLIWTSHFKEWRLTYKKSTLYLAFKLVLICQGNFDQYITGQSK